MGFRDRALARWLSACRTSGFAHGSDLTRLLGEEAYGLCFTDSWDADQLLRRARDAGWVTSTGFRPTRQQARAGVGGGTPSPSYPSCHGWEPAPVVADEQGVVASSATSSSPTDVDA